MPAFTRPCALFAVLLVLRTAAAQNDARVIAPARRPARVAVAWNDSNTGAGIIRAMGTRPPWRFRTPPLQVDREPILRFARGRLYAVSPAAGMITVVDPQAWSIIRVLPLGPATEPRDIAVLSRRLAYVSRGASTHLLRLDPVSGASAEVVDLSPFAGPQGAVDMGTLAVHDGRLFVQVRRNFALPAYIAVVDLATEQLIDADAQTPGVQAIELQGNTPHFKMQVAPQSRRLFVSANGMFHDDGGLEMIDLDNLESIGFAADERNPNLGAQLGAFVMMTADRGYLVFSTDLLLSSHTTAFRVSDGTFGPGSPVTSLDYFVPALVYAQQADALFLPFGSFGEFGVHAIDAQSGMSLTTEPVPTGGPITDLALLPSQTFRSRRLDFDAP